LREQFWGDIVELLATNHLTGCRSVVLYLVLYQQYTEDLREQIWEDIVELSAINHLTGCW
jgi:hypothetical protein